ncbi:hypothetical protein CP09DC77_1190B, partial [Chlamydia psittaci 09DC77]
MVKMEIS